MNCPYGFGEGWADTVRSDWRYCLQATISGETVAYPPTFGLSCQKHFEPGNEDCFDQATNTELAVGVRADWCDNQWCYIDPCDCNVEQALSLYFEGEAYAYSYDTCGSEDAFAATIVGGTQVAQCSSGNSEGNSGVNSGGSSAANLAGNLTIVTITISASLDFDPASDTREQAAFKSGVMTTLNLPNSVVTTEDVVLRFEIATGSGRRLQTNYHVITTITFPRGGAASAVQDLLQIASAVTADALQANVITAFSNDGLPVPAIAVAEIGSPMVDTIAPPNDGSGAEDDSSAECGARVCAAVTVAFVAAAAARE